MEKASKADGYQVQYSLKKNFKSKKVKWTKKTKISMRGLKKKKTYYFRVRAYKRSNGKKVYGKWSKVVKKKCK